MAEDSKNFEVQIITPDRVFYSGQAEMIEFNTSEGEIGVYKNHIPLTTLLAPGIVTIKIHGSEVEKKAAVHTGFAEILGEKVTILAEEAEWPDEIDLERAKAAMERAKKRLEERKPETDIMRAELALKKSLVRIGIKG